MWKSAQLGLTVWICSKGCLICNQDYRLLTIMLKVYLTLKKKKKHKQAISCMVRPTKPLTMGGVLQTCHNDWPHESVATALSSAYVSAYVTNQWTTFSDYSLTSEGVSWVKGGSVSWQKGPFSLNSYGFVWKTLSLLLPMALEMLGTCPSLQVERVEQIESPSWVKK